LTGPRVVPPKGSLEGGLGKPEFVNGYVLDLPQNAEQASLQRSLRAKVRDPALA